ncbi:hypothetical protein HH308_11215 [Gordonia sp. TBRC 11910]|uniref:Transcriptional regulator, AbiEi antitoxin, Type IV TA system n=1 Tax=Gordonia asplenii TaxID=2725283 RepID=A0A848KU31_9ACTN|nr:type IV toxin-antitoxin system AbiEi family antitoxin domain-containing protein [Gordonia asplenii]NMO01782.1 hypothetical protein [Gordonia asplenii]
MTQLEIDENCTRRELLDRGYDDSAIWRALGRGDIDRIGPGLYAPPHATLPSREALYVERVKLWARKLAPPPLRPVDRALADVSAAAVLGLPLWGLPTQRVVASDFTRPPGTRQSRVVRLVTDRRLRDTVTVGGVALPVTAPARTVVDIARRYAKTPAVAVGDAALFTRLCTVDDLHRELDLAKGMTGAGRAREFVGLMDGRAESVLESRSRIEMRELQLPTPTLQHEFLTAAGTCVARVDFYWPEFRLVGEADGTVKYQDPSVLRREKERTDRLHELGLRVVRWGWATLNDREAFAQRLLAMMNAPSTSFTGTHLAG